MAAITAFLNSDEAGRLKAELQALRRRGALKSGDWSSPPPDPDRTCGRCRVELGRVINRGAYCQSCRLKVCKGCRAYAFRTTDWVCTVCHKRMEIQAVSGEWMNEFVRRPSRRRDNRVYVPAADIIKRTIRRSWTISSPSTRWNSPRGSQPLRPYNSLPRGQDIIKYPSLLPYHHEYSNKRTSPKMQKHTPAQRSHSEDVYAEREVPCHKEVAQLLDDDETRYISTIEILTRPRVNPLAKAAAEGKLTTAVPFEMKTCTPPPEHILNQSNDANEPAEETTNKKVEEKRVSFEEVIVPKKFDKLFSKARSKAKDKSILKPQSLHETVVKKSKLFSRRSLPEEIEKADISLNEAEVVENIKEEEIVNEQCDIEPFSGTVFRKVTVQRRRQDMRKVPAIDNDESDDIALALKIEDQIEKAYDEQNPISSNVSDPQVTLVTGEQAVEAIGTDAPNTSNDDLKKENETEGETKTEVPNCGQSWRRGPESEILDILLPEGDDYKLVFISSDSSSKEEDVDDNDSSSTASSFLIDDCDWDYFEPSTGTRPFLNWNSPFGSPRVYRRGGLESPLGSPLVYRRAKGSDTGTDEDARLDSDSPSSSDRSRETEDQGDFSRNEPTMDDIAVACVHPPETTEPLPRLCQSCGSPTQYIPIPVPVPIPVPIPALWYPSFVRFGFDTFDQPVRSRLRGFPRSIWPYVNQAALIWPLITTGEANAIFSSAQNSIADECATVTNDSMLLASKRNETSAVPAPDPVPVDKVEVKNNEVIKYEFASEHGEELYGHLTSENVNMDTDSSERSTDEESGDDTKPRVRRTYNVSGGNLRESDDALPSSEVSSDSEAEDQSSVREDDMSSSGSADTDSNDTGTVADQKPKRFSRVLVVNNSISSSSSCAGSIINESLDSGSDSSDNDTDTEKDCGVVLTNIKLLPDCDFSDSLQNALNGICDNKDSLNESEAAVVGGGKLLSSSEINSIVNDCLSTSPGLSDVSAESHHSSDNEDGITEINGEEMQAQVYNNNNYSAVTEEQQGISTSAGIRSDESQTGVGNGESNRGERTGVPVASELDDALQRHATRYTSLVMITQEPTVTYPQVSVVTSDTTTLIPDNDIVVRHTNWQLKNDIQDSEYKRYLTLTLENSSTHTPAPQQQKSPTQSEENCDVTVVASSDAPVHINNKDHSESVTVITGADTLSALVYLEDGLADDDSWVENLSIDEEDLVCSTQSDESSSSGDEVTLTCTAAIDQDDDHGYQRSAIDFTLHTIVEESCEESEVEQQNTIRKKRPTSATDLEKYFFFGLGDGNISSINSARDDAMSETSSICSEGMDSLGIPEEIVSSDSMDPAELASSRLEKYFLTGFMGFTAERRDSDGSVGSDSEGRPSPEQRRKRLVRARGTGRSHSSSLDNLLAHSELSGTDQGEQVNSEELSSSDTDTNEDGTGFEKSEGQFDTVKRKKNKKPRTIAPGTNSPEETKLESTHEENHSEDDGNKTPQPNLSLIPESRHQQSRDSGFIGSCDDLIKEQRDSAEPALTSPTDSKIELERISEEKKTEDRTTSYPPPPATSLTRKDSFNNWSSDEETNLMMCKMRQFFKTMIANNGPPAKPATPTLGKDSPKLLQSPRFKNRYKPPQLVYFESELTRLMKSVPGIRDDQVREIVEYLSSEDTWSDSYDSSDYTSSDLEGATCNKSLLQQQISDSCQEIINKFDTGGGESADESCGLNKETAFVYQKLVASLEKMATNDTTGTKIPHTPHSSPPLIAKVMHHIGSRLVALMHEVSSGESHASNSPKTRHYHRRIHPKLSNASSTTTEEDDYITENLMERLENLDDVSNYAYLPRSRSHDLLLSESKNLHQSSSGVSDIAEERETSDYERFSWRGSFESALMATDSRNKLSIIGSEGSASASALAVAAKRRSAGDLMFSNKSLSREQLDRVRSCGSIGGGSNSEDKLWVANTNRPTRRSSVPDAASGSGGSADGEDDDDDDEDEELENRATLPRSLQTSTATTNSLPRLPTTTPATNMYKAHSMYHFLQQNVKSARYRPPGFNKFSSAPKRAVSAPGLQPSHQRRGRRSQQSSIIVPDDAGLSEANSSPMVMAKATNKSGTPSPVSQSSKKELLVKQGEEWTGNNEEDIDRLVAIHTNRSSLSSLGIRSDSMASVYSGAGEGRYGAVTVRGQVEFRLQYNYKAGALEILIIQCKDLAAVDAKRNRSDPYVKVYLLPDKSKSGKRKTKVRKHTLNPVFDECLKFHISITGLETRTLWLTVWHSDMFGRNDFLGEVRMALENKIFDDPTPKWYNLQERTEPFEDVLSFKGDVLVGLKFVPPDMTVVKKGKRSRGTLHVKVKEAKSLTAVKSNGTSDPFCKSYLLPDKGRTSKQKTAVIRKTINAVWNHTFVYDDVTLQELAERCLELTVWDHDRLGSNEFLGGVRFSLGEGKHYGKSVDWMDSTGKEVSLWKSMLERPNFWVEGCLPLRPTLDYRTS